ncbi:NAD(P)-dependent alcohol dehydrogenase [Paradevosia shaoguanensis]|uniref:NAD(P)-dependent alcohol dehydrogenase n=1 Tax=Paradevosia shaoguanensis TaxID=1335043 RepID=A0AA41QJV4_9HYPH|nr:NAD(P)-dependent alcohol dehydrogenase [Paradevosia shaoguanensis]MCF1741360.1 NAD(P)-dependent alcohol dehydrogenase [Paradevosia shaoguanensis]MCI0125843.1 NAD(P)-dependent alcohol dehydrogenase [Paradevosia shaoguanensis]
MPHALAYGAKSATTPLVPLTITRRDPGPTDVRIDIVYCGVCHSDLHTARGEWGGVKFPAIPGHEIVGKVIAVGDKVEKFKVGDTVGVGCMVDSCRECASCREGLEQYCEAGNIGTYNAPDKHLGGHTFGGYTSEIVVDQDFVLSISNKLPLAAAAPLLCAGITLWSPLVHWGAGPGKKVGIVGLGGLGHMGVKLAKALGAEVVMFTTSPSKVADAQKLGAHEAVISTDKEAMARHKRSFDLIINTVSAPHDLDLYMALLKRDGAQVLVGLPSTPHDPIKVGRMIGNRLTLAASTIGGIRETQEMLDFCAEHSIVSDIETIDIQSINDAYERMLRGDVKYRFVIDMASLKNGAKAA